MSSITNIRVPESLHAEVNLLLLDPVAHKVRWGALSALITRLLAQWVEEQRKNPAEAHHLRSTSFNNLRNEPKVDEGTHYE
jgi:hypothetical protein